ncbi:DGQHR domain-containing protein [Oceanomicrobium pacificus]|uniref:DGQHR domain-containing protein n=1 Tax=Oceanomicrobium pacificus TaxID=2692916 RepID=A0A6B0TRJ6_9RHOB|nr:DGQHR domain-containing protein [Oceanomicrobium pacificus]MXU63812.1 DGQHR domain-containing protein [Oceanomicrobium pacificus]
MIEEAKRTATFPVLRTRQPIGDFYIGKMAAKDLINISWFDVRRRAGDGELDEYMGIQRRVSEDRVKEIAQYVTLSDATFPTAVILAVEAKCTTLEAVCDQDAASDFFLMTLQNNPGDLDNPETVLFRGIARVLDGQHRIRGLMDAKQDFEDFEVNVCVFVDADIADQASIFATVNLAQTKVNRSLVYDLLSYSKSRSPERTAHTVTVALDSNENSPLYRRIKRLGVSTEGRFGEVLTQATVVRSILPYISNDVLRDRDIGKKKSGWRHDASFDRKKLIFRQYFIEERDEEIARQIMHYFEAVKRRWEDAWNSTDKGNMLPRTNGFRAFARFLRPAILNLGEGDFVKMSIFKELFESMSLEDRDFNTDNFPPGGTGERKLFDRLMEEANFGEYS